MRRQHNITTEKAVIEFLHRLKEQGLSISTLADYETIFADFFQGEGTEIISDITRGSPIQHIEAVDTPYIDAYKARLINEELSLSSINGHLQRLLRLFEYCEEQGYMDALEVELLSEE